MTTIFTPNYSASDFNTTIMASKKEGHIPSDYITYLTDIPEKSVALKKIRIETGVIMGDEKKPEIADEPRDKSREVTAKALAGFWLVAQYTNAV